MTKHEEITIPVGRHVLPLGERQAAEIRTLLAQGTNVELVGVRVWIDRLDGRLLLHIGELQVSPVP
ncbi:MAG TPA: hypothetical protein VIK91_25340 [Nannocystis sp.]